MANSACTCIEHRLGRVALERFPVAVAVLDQEGGLIALNKRGLESPVLGAVGLLDGAAGDVSDFFAALRKDRRASATIWRTSGERVDYFALEGVAIDGYVVTAVAELAPAGDPSHAEAVRAALDELKAQVDVPYDDMPE